MDSQLDSFCQWVNHRPLVIPFGRTHSVEGLGLKVHINDRRCAIGTQCDIQKNEGPSVRGEIVGFEGSKVWVMPYGSLEGLSPQVSVSFLGTDKVWPHESWKGRVLNALCEPLDLKSALSLGSKPMSLQQVPPNPQCRDKVTKRLDVGVKAINTFATVCQGQRLGIFAGSGVGKSKLLSMLARYTECDVCIIGLIGERGREVREFIEDTLGEEGLKKSILVVATSNESPLMRRRAAYLTLTLSEFFSQQGQSVLCLMDSVTRFAMAQREIGLSAMEPPTTKGYPPSTFVELAKLMERAGPGEGGGSITAFFTVLVDGDDHNEPIADATRGILDGHIVLDRVLAEQNHYPAIHILKSLSRLVPSCHSLEERALVARARKFLSLYISMAEMIRLGAYRKGSDPAVDEAIAYFPAIETFLAQKPEECVSLPHSFHQLAEALKAPLCPSHSL